MAIARVGTGSGLSTCAAATSLTINYTPAGTGRLLTTSCGYWETASTGTPTIADNNTTAWTVKDNRRANGQGAVHGYLENNGSGITSVTISFGTGSGTYGHAAVDEWTGVATSSSFDQQVNASGATPTNTLGSGNLTATVNGELILGACNADDNSTSNWTSTLNGFTDILSYGDTQTNTAAETVYQIAGATTGPFSLTWNYAAGRNDMVSNLVAFKPSGTSTFTITPSGGVTFSGSAAQIHTNVVAPAGGVAFSGSAPEIRTRVQVPSGSVVFGGTAPITFTNGQTFVLSPSGGFVLSGSAPEVRTRAQVPAGGVALGGAAPLIRTDVWLPSGSVLFGGSAPMSFVPAGGVPSQPQRMLTGVGQ